MPHRSALESNEQRLWSPLLQPNLGLTPDASEPLEAGPSLQRHLALIGEAALGCAPGRHGTDVGFAIMLADLLRVRYDQISSLQSQWEEPRSGSTSAAAESSHAESLSGDLGSGRLANGDMGGDESMLSQAAREKRGNAAEATGGGTNGVLSHASLELAELLEVRVTVGIPGFLTMHTLSRMSASMDMSAHMRMRPLTCMCKV